MSTVIYRKTSSGDVEVEFRDLQPTEWNSLPPVNGFFDGASLAQGAKVVPAISLREGYRAFFKELGTSLSQEIAHALYVSGGSGLTDEELRDRFELDGFRLGGAMSGLTKAEHRAGLPREAALRRERSGSAGNFAYRYWLTEECREAYEKSSTARRFAIKHQSFKANLPEDDLPF